MSGLKAYYELTNAGAKDRAQHDHPTPKRGISELITMATHDRLESEAPWTLSSAAARRLEQQAGFRPPGGWPSCAGIAAAANLLAVDPDGFSANMSSEELQALSNDEVRKRCLEGFTRWLAPPAAAAGLFVCLGLHPIWGLRLVQSLDSPFCNVLEIDEERVLPDTNLKLVRQTAFGTIACIVATLRTLDSGMVYPISALTPVVVAACQCARQVAADASDGRHGLPMFVATMTESEAAFRRIADVAILDILDTVLVPAGAATRSSDGGFSVCDGALDGVMVGDYDEDDQKHWLGWMTAVEPRFVVA